MYSLLDEMIVDSEKVEREKKILLENLYYFGMRIAQINFLQKKIK